jgi:hypothetical protein
MFQSARPGSPRIKAVAGYLVEALRSIDPFDAQPRFRR